MHSHPEIAALLTSLENPHLKAIDLGLERMEKILDACGNPQLRIPPVIHVAGTNGKGSTIAFLRAIFENAGYKCHVYTSPHLVRFNERIVIAGEEIGDGHLLELLGECKELSKKHPVTFFEATTLAAFLAFSRAEADITLLEVGLGGRLDATNVIPAPLLSVITPVSFDHRQQLGDSLQSIATEKAGIIKRDVHCIVSRQAPEAMQAISRIATSVSAPLFSYGDDWSIDNNTYKSTSTSFEIPPPSLFGQHQYLNAGAAIAAISQQKLFNISEDDLTSGITNAKWPGRMQFIRSGKLAGLASPHQIWLDGGHNEGAAEVIKHQLLEWQDAPVYLILGMIRTKEPEEFLSPLKNLVHEVICIDIPEEPLSLPASRLLAACEALGIPAFSATSIESAIQRITFVNQPMPEFAYAEQLAAEVEFRHGFVRILLTGSLYLVGKALEINGEIS